MNILILSEEMFEATNFAEIRTAMNVGKNEEFSISYKNVSWEYSLDEDADRAHNSSYFYHNGPASRADVVVGDIPTEIRELILGGVHGLLIPVRNRFGGILRYSRIK